MSLPPLIPAGETRPRPRLERVIIPADVFTALCVVLMHASDATLGLVRVTTRKAELAGGDSDYQDYEPFLLAISHRIDQMQQMLRTCMDESSPEQEAYHG